MVRPIVRVLAPVPKVALYPALLLLLGFDHASKITLVAADALFPILLATYYGATQVEQKLISEGVRHFTLHARMNAKAFYAKCGYEEIGETFMEVGRPHVRMDRYV